MATSIERSEKDGWMNNLGPNIYHKGENSVKISPVDSEIAG